MPQLWSVMSCHVIRSPAIHDGRRIFFAPFRLPTRQPSKISWDSIHSPGKKYCKTYLSTPVHRPGGLPQWRPVAEVSIPFFVLTFCFLHSGEVRAPMEKALALSPTGGKRNDLKLDWPTPNASDVSLSVLITLFSLHPRRSS